MATSLKKWGVFSPVNKKISDDITVYSDKKIQFRDTGIYIQSSADGKLKISSDGSGADDIILDGNVTCNNDLTISGSFSYGAVTATSFVNTGTTQLGDAVGDTITMYGSVATSGNPNFNWGSSSGTFSTGTGAVTLAGNVSISGAKTFGTGTGAVSLNGDTTVATTKAFNIGTGSAIGGTVSVYRDGAGNKSLEIVPGTSITIKDNFSQSGAYTFTTGTGLLTAGGDLQVNGNDIQDAGGSAAITFDGSGNTTVNGNLSVTGTFEIADASVTGDFDIQGTDLQATTGTLNISKSGSATTVKGTLNVDEAVTFDTTLAVAGATTLNGTTQLGDAKADTVTFYGDVAANGAQNPDIDFSGSSGTFKSSSGENTLSGNVTISGSKTFATGTGAVSLNGDVTVAVNKDVVTSGTGYFQGVNAQLTNIKANDGTACLDITDATGALGIAGTTTIATTKDLVMGTVSAIAGDLKAYRDGAGNPSFVFNPGTSIVLYENTSISGAYTFGTGTGAVSLNGDTTVATTKNLVMGTGSAIGGTLTIYRDGAGNKALELIPATSLTIAENTILSGATTLTTGTGLTTISGDISISGHFDSQEFTANAFQYPAPGTDWTPEVTGAVLAANKAAKKVWIPLNFLKIGDEIVSYKLVGDVHEEGGDTVTLDCKLVRVNKADPLTTTDVTNGGITQVVADGNFDSEAVLSSPETVATDKQYVLEILGTTSNVSTNEAIKVIGAEVKVNRK